ncbi:MAG TPA: SPASM domain-containing protein [Anaerolineae bacterium]|nr:SPASM domain-containing protein [Anaerolineae bacterium]
MAKNPGKAGSLRARVGSGGTLQVPEEVRESWGLAPQAELLIEETADGLVLRPADPPLRKVYVEPTAACNLSCKTCVRNTWAEPMGSMPLSTYRRLVEGLREVGSLHTMAFWGIGEPLVHPGIVEMVALAHDLGVRTEMISNGLLLDQARARGLIEAGLDSLVLSVDGATPEAHAGARPGADLGTVEGSAALLHRLRQEMGRINPEIGLEFVATRRNLAELPGLRRLALHMKASFVVVTNVLPYCAEFKDDILYGLLPTPPQAERSFWRPEMVLPRIDARSETLGPLAGLMQHVGLLDPLHGRPAGGDSYCRFVREGSAAVSWDGSVSPCVPLMHSYTCYVLGREKAMRRYVLGNVDDVPLPSIWAKDEYRAFRERVIAFDFSPCVDCGGCTFAETNEEDCYGNPFPVCGDCLWARGIIQCP